MQVEGLSANQTSTYQLQYVNPLGVVTAAQNLPTDSTGATGYATFTPESWYWSIRATFIHETKHVASYVARVVNGTGNFEVSWLEEGTARHAEEIWARQIYGAAWKGNARYGSDAAPGNPGLAALGPQHDVDPMDGAAVAALATSIGAAL